MLENIRKYSLLMALVVVLIAVSLILTSYDNKGGRGSDEVVNVNGQSYKMSEASNQFAALQPLLTQIVADRSLLKLTSELYPYAEHLKLMTSYEEESKQVMPLINQLLINQEAAKLGIFVSRENAKDYILQELFADETKQTDFSSYNNFVDNTLKKVSIKESDFVSIIVNMLTYQKLLQVKMPDYLTSHISIHQKDIHSQTLDTTIVQFAVSDFKNKVEATDEEAGVFFEKYKNDVNYAESFRTSKQYKLSYVTVNFDKIDTPEEISAAHPEDFDKVAALTQAAEEQVAKSADRFRTYKKFVSDESLDRDAKNLEEIAKKYNYTVKTTPLVGPENLAEFLPDYPTLRRMQRYGSLHKYLFKGNVKKAASVKVLIPGQIQSSYVFYRIDEEKFPETKTFEQAKEAAKILLKDDLAHKATLKATEDAKKQLQQLLDSKQDLAPLIKEKNWKSFDFAAFSPRSEAKDLQQIKRLYDKAIKVEPQHISPIVSDSKFAAIAIVKKREIEKADGYEAIDKADASKNGAQFAQALFDEWITSSFKQAKITYEGRPNQK